MGDGGDEGVMAGKGVMGLWLYWVGDGWLCGPRNGWLTSGCDRIPRSGLSASCPSARRPWRTRIRTCLERQREQVIIPNTGRGRMFGLANAVMWL
jgi:hypothetical protein